MIVTLYKNGTTGNSGQAIVRAIAGVLAGTILSPSDVDASFFTAQNCSWSVGSYPIPTYWTIDQDASSVASAGTITLSSPSRLVNRRNVLVLTYSGNYVWYNVADSVVGGVAQNVTDVGFHEAFSTSYDGYFDTPFNIAFADGFVVIWSPKNFLHHASSSYTRSYLFLGLEMTDNAYDAYSLEGTFKGFGFFQYSYFPAGVISVSIAVSNMYQPKYDTYITGRTWTNAYNGFTSASSGNFVSTFRCSNTVDASHAIVPLTFNYLSLGWLGGNISTKSGLYFTTSTNKGWPVPNDDNVTLGDNTYRVFASGSAGGPGTTTLLVKI